MKKLTLLILIMIYPSLLLACQTKGTSEVGSSLTPSMIAVQSLFDGTLTNIANAPTVTSSSATTSPTPNLENDRPAPPTAGLPPTETSTTSAGLTATPQTGSTLPETTPSTTTSTSGLTATQGPSPTASRTSNPTRTPTGTLPTPTPSHTQTRTPTGTQFSPTPSRTVVGTQTITSTPTNTPISTLNPGIAFTVTFTSHYSCQEIEFLNFLVENTGSQPLEYSKVIIIDLSGREEITNSFTNWPFQSLPEGCANDLGSILPGGSAYMPVPIIESEYAPPPYPGEHQGTFTFCSEDYLLYERGVCASEEVIFTIP